MTSSSVCFPVQLPCQFDFQFSRFSYPVIMSVWLSIHYVFPIQLPCHCELWVHYGFHIQIPMPFTSVKFSCHIWYQFIMSPMTVHYTIYEYHTTYDIQSIILCMTTMPPINSGHQAIYDQHTNHDTQFTILYMNTTFPMTLSLLYHIGLSYHLCYPVHNITYDPSLQCQLYRSSIITPSLMFYIPDYT